MANLKIINIIYFRNKHPSINENSPDIYISGLLIVLLNKILFQQLV